MRTEPTAPLRTPAPTASAASVRPVSGRATGRSITARWIRAAAALTGLVTAAVLTAPAAVAAPAESTAPPGSVTPGVLAAVGDAVGAADVAGTAWYTDTAARQVVVTADSTVDTAGLTRLRAAADGLPGALRIERTSGTLGALVSGGDRIYRPGGSCTAGFNVRNTSGTYYILTAGHCTTTPATWYVDGGLTVPIGPVAGGTFPGQDFGLIRYDNPAVPRPGTVGTVDITGAANPSIGLRVSKRGATTGVTNGTVLGLNATVNYGGGNIVYGLIQTNICAQPGDSGAPLYSGTTALGILSGGSGNCVSGGVSFYQRVVPVLSQYGVSVY
ncbi:S1 family peptidase [Streptomyces sp. NPDC000594]|uniref:S1 family peptidase n=1 Tax=Streptomyces sp. NPDC000594 TaxID=3154261 RepID=UPI00331A9A59